MTDPVPVQIANPLEAPYRTGAYLISDVNSTGLANFRSAIHLADHPYRASGSHQLSLIDFATGQWAAIDPIHVHRVHGAGQCDVEQAQALLKLFAEMLATVFDEIHRAQIDAALATGIVIAQQFRRAHTGAIADTPD